MMRGEDRTWRRRTSSTVARERGCSSLLMSELSRETRLSRVNSYITFIPTPFHGQSTEYPILLYTSSLFIHVNIYLGNKVIGHVQRSS